MIQNINIDMLFPHPNNPRKDLGDLTELTESIKANGIFQNLTVVPYYSQIKNRVIEGTYTVIIGHRRLAAAKLAGLTEVPCAIVEMSEKDQLATMLLENMQRSDLTVYEQAQGFQLMLDLGENVESIAEKTGFSKSTINRRVKLLDLDKELFKQGQERGATLEDYAKLDKIADTELKNRALKSIGTGNFEYEVNACIREQERQQNIEKWVKVLSTFATESKTDADWKKHEYNYIYTYNSTDSYVIPNDADDKQYYFYVGKYYTITLFKEKENVAEETNDKYEQERKEREERTSRLQDVAVQCAKCRMDFIKQYSEPAKQSDRLDSLIKAVEGYMSLTNDTTAILCEIDQIEEYKSFYSLVGCDIPTDETIFENADYLHDLISADEALKSVIRQQTTRFILANLFLRFEEHHSDGTIYYIGSWDYYGHYRELSAYDKEYISLYTKLGYQMSDVERALLDGTSELYLHDEDSDDDK